MTGNEILARISSLQPETLDQPFLFEVKVETNHDGDEIICTVPATHIGIAREDYLMSPGGVLSRDLAVDQFMQMQIEAASGECQITEEELQEYNPGVFPVLVNQNQLVFKLQVIDVKQPIEAGANVDVDIYGKPLEFTPPFGSSDDKPEWLAKADAAFGAPKEVEGPLDYWLTSSQLQFLNRVLREWEASKGKHLLEEDKYLMDSVRESLLPY